MYISNVKDVAWNFDTAVQDLNLNCSICHIGNLTDNVEHTNKCPFCDSPGGHGDAGWEFNCGCQIEDNRGPNGYVVIRSLCKKTEEGQKIIIGKAVSITKVKQ